MVAVIGDIHGCYYTLKALVEKVRSKYSDIPIYCVGDLVDRGNFSFQVIDFVASEKINFTLGNHDYMFYCNMREPFSIMARSWNYNGAETTIASYKENMSLMDKHLDFIIKAPLFYNLDDCFISHAGVSIKYQPVLVDNKFTDEYLNDLFKKDLDDHHSIIWTRDNLFNLQKLQVVGHTHRKEIFHDKTSNSLYIDTTAYGNNKLTSVIIENNTCLEVIEQKSIQEDINDKWIYQL